MEKCANCNAIIGNLETPFVWQDRTVCHLCYQRLIAQSAGATGRPGGLADRSTSDVSRGQANGLLSTIAIIIVATVIVGIVGFFLFSERLQGGYGQLPAATGQVPVSQTPISAGTAPLHEPEFEFARRATMDGALSTASVAWAITNTSSTPLIVNRVVYNGEHDASLAEPMGGVDTGVQYYAVLSGHKLPVTLTIGDTAWFFQDCELMAGGTNSDYYKKAVVFADVYTNRGHFRYKVGEGLEFLPN